jgi:hypothetical protein
MVNKNFPSTQSLLWKAFHKPGTGRRGPIPVILVTWEVKPGGLRFQASVGKEFMTVHLQNNQSKMG